MCVDTAELNSVAEEVSGHEVPPPSYEELLARASKGGTRGGKRRSMKRLLPHALAQTAERQAKRAEFARSLTRQMAEEAERVRAEREREAHERRVADASARGMRICRSCNKETDDNRSYCSHCGAYASRGWR